MRSTMRSSSTAVNRAPFPERARVTAGPATREREFVAFRFIVRVIEEALFCECGADSNITEARRRSAVARAHCLDGLTLPAIRRAPERPVIAGANRVAVIPEFCGDAAVAGILQHASFFAAFNVPADFGGKLEMVAAV